MELCLPANDVLPVHGQTFTELCSAWAERVGCPRLSETNVGLSFDRQTSGAEDSPQVFVGRVLPRPESAKCPEFPHALAHCHALLGHAQNHRAFRKHSGNK